MQEQQATRNDARARFVRLLAGAGCLAALAQGCAVGPSYKRPPIESPATFRSAPANPSTNSLADLQWWELYQDKTLNSLIRTALTNNYDLRIAIARVDQSRAIASQARAQFVPQVGYEGAVSRGRNELLGNASPPGPTGARTADAAFAALNASWEIDLWGRIRRLNESARAAFLASEEGRHGVRCSGRSAERAARTAAGHSAGGAESAFRQCPGWSQRRGVSPEDRAHHIPWQSQWRTVGLYRRHSERVVGGQFIERAHLPGRRAGGAIP